jgi:D-sedoheptulose 7-phosphate isomerase
MDATRGPFVKSFRIQSENYLLRLHKACEQIPLEAVEVLADAMRDAWRNKRQVFIFGNGGSAGNAIHLANDFIFGVSREFGSGLRIHALPANASVITCLANDIGYENIFAYQLSLMSDPGDLVIALSGSGNSPNIIKALEYAEKADLESFAILGFSGGASLNVAKNAIHIPVNDMQISEDLQLIIGHMVMQYLYSLVKTLNT